MASSMACHLLSAMARIAVGPRTPASQSQQPLFAPPGISNLAQTQHENPNPTCAGPPSQEE
eukprot:235428-Amphidinium_carterae.1